MTDLKQKLLKKAAVHQDLKSWWQPPVFLTRQYTIKLYQNANATNQENAFLIDSPDQIFWSKMNTGNWASKNTVDHDLLHH